MTETNLNSTPVPIPVDQQAINTAVRWATGAHLHDITQTISLYTYHCKRGNEAEALKYKRHLTELVIYAQQNGAQDMTSFQNPVVCTWCGNGQDLVDLDDYCLNCGRNNHWRKCL